MNIKDILEVSFALLGSLGGGGAIVLGLSNYLGRIWADRGLEKQRHEYSQLNIAMQSQLDVATRRLQVEFDALKLIHTLRTQEEFNKLSELWKRVADLRNYYGLLVPQGLQLVFSDTTEQNRLNRHNREMFEKCLNEMQKYLAEEALFIPEKICKFAEEAISAAALERFNYAAFSPYLVENNTVPRSGNPFPGDDIFQKMRMQYYDAKKESFEKFCRACKELEHLMREHVKGHTLSSNSV